MNTKVWMKSKKWNVEVINFIVSQIFADHSTVHLQKDLVDDGNGWLLNRRFIPEHNTVQFEMFRDRNKHKYELVWKVISADSF